MKRLYMALATLGAIAPYLFFIQHFSTAGFGLGSFISALFVNGAAGGFSTDLLISSLVLWIYIFSEGKVKRPWAFVLVNLLIGLSCALPLYLYFLEERKALKSH